MTNSNIWSSKRLIKSSQDIIKFLIDYIPIKLLKLTKIWQYEGWEALIYKHTTYQKWLGCLSMQSYFFKELILSSFIQLKFWVVGLVCFSIADSQRLSMAQANATLYYQLQNLGSSMKCIMAILNSFIQYSTMPRKKKIGDFKAVKPFIMDDPWAKIQCIAICKYNTIAQRPSTDSAPSGTASTTLR